MGARHSFELAAVFVWRELAVRYKRSWLGLVWALVEPVVNVVVYALVFGFVFGARELVDSYPLFVVFGVLPWTFFAGTVESSGHALLEYAPLLRKVAFRRELIIVAVVVSRFSTLLVGLVLAFAWAALWTARGAQLSWEHAPLVGVGCLLLFFFTLGISLVVASLQAILGDVAFLTRFALRLGFYAVPVIYPLARVPDVVRGFYDLNPLVGILTMFNGIASGAAFPSPLGIAASMLGTLFVGVGGFVFFRRAQPAVSEVI
jgi:ABC-type polysaccharide/polyol phosphate export permease